MNKTLEEIAVITYGKDYKKNPPGDNIPIYGTGGIMGYTSKPLNSGPSVLTGRKGSINKPFYVDGDFWNVDTIYCIKTTPIINTKWFYYNLCNKNLSILNEATGVPSVSTSALNKLQFHYVDFPHQRKIARILTTVDSIIEKTEAAIAKYKAIKQGMMHDLFTRGIDVKTGKLRPKFEDAPELYKESELGWIPKEWEVKRIDEILKAPIRDFGSFSMTNLIEFVDSGVPFLKTEVIQDGFINFEDVSYITPNVHRLLYKSFVNKGDILFTKIGAIGRVAVYDGELGVCNSNAASAKIQINTTYYNNHFIALKLGSDRVIRDFEKAIISTPPRINLGDINSMPLELPKKIEQDFIAKRLQSIINRIIVEEKNLKKQTLLKSGLMQDLLTGKKEVTPDPEDYANDGEPV